MAAIETNRFNQQERDRQRESGRGGGVMKTEELTVVTLE